MRRRQARTSDISIKFPKQLGASCISAQPARTRGAARPFGVAWDGIPALLPCWTRLRGGEGGAFPKLAGFRCVTAELVELAPGREKKLTRAGRECGVVSLLQFHWTTYLKCILRRPSARRQGPCDSSHQRHDNMLLEARLLSHYRNSATLVICGV